MPVGHVFAPAVTRIDAATARIIDLRPQVEAGAPWPLAARFGTEPEASWGPPEVLAHLAEMLPFWLGEVERILAGPVDPTPFGRIATDEIRTATIGRDRSLPPRELFARIATGVRRYDERFGELGPADAARVGRHPRLGEMTVAEILDRFVAAHLEEHADQLRTLLG